ncbi:MAG: hypothetical protein IPF77_16840 [Gemmatimonadetes bacterium]|nr:hypothetical protein [Gemmatimonadota bacterium]
MSEIESKLWHLVRIAALHKGDRESKYVQRAVESVLTEFATLRARIIREVVEKLPGIAAPEADFIAVEWFTEAGRFPYRVAMPRAALLDALLGTDGQEPA